MGHANELNEIISRLQAERVVKKTRTNVVAPVVISKPIIVHNKSVSEPCVKCGRKVKESIDKLSQISDLVKKKTKKINKDVVELW